MRPSKVGRESLAFSVVGEHLSVISRLNAALDKKNVLHVAAGIG